MCLSLCGPMYVCLLAYKSGTGGAIISKFQGSSKVLRDGLGAKMGDHG